MAFFLYAALSFLFYLLLTAGMGGEFLLWSRGEFFIGAVVSLIVAFFAHKFLPPIVTRQIANPLKWIALALYMIFPFLLVLIIANIEVAYRVITGRIKPAIIKLDTDFKGALGTFFLANSITLSPGTLSLELDDSDSSIFVHCLSWEKPRGRGISPKEIAPFIYFWLKRFFK